MPKTHVGKQKYNAKQEAWLAEFQKNGHNATKAARVAGYAHPDVQGPRLKKKLWVDRIKPEIDKVAEEAGITAVRVLKETEALAFSDVTHYIQDEHGYLALAPGVPADAMRAVSSVKYRTVTTGSGESQRTTRECEFKLWDKPGMVKLAGKHVDVHGFADRMELTGNDGKDLEFTLQIEGNVRK